ncbi:hypothetical protein B0O80DRAFT_474959 [Mortierella sp. GBAus27b]|nr:hypothetical protein B0O80DRAFT_474959 [Mortierella sp. GBAus27b]
MGWDDVVEHHLSELSLACFVLLLSMNSYVNGLILALYHKSCFPFGILAIDTFLMEDEIGGISYRGRQDKATAEVVYKR